LGRGGGEGKYFNQFRRKCVRRENDGIHERGSLLLYNLRERKAWGEWEDGYPESLAN